ncbi:Hsp33 family molecular chaperone HslO [Paenibacillus sp. HJGM_3]|uniref:Hsp33 family molecular chaperone HslO n=1 Tax=Paenibacillus sp. HJGM_3 TaxID=3379816 RepID=UPI00385DB7FC
MQQDYLIRATALNGKVRAFAANITGILEELRARHKTSPVATAALGRTLAAAAMMGAMLKGEEKLTIQVKGNGPIGQIVVEANADGDLRGYVDDPSVELPLNGKGKLDVAGAVGTEGFIYIIKDLGLREPYRGSTPIVSGELGEDFTYYFAKSEQTPSAVALGVLVDTDRTVRTSGGFIIQLMPGLAEEEIAELEARLSGLPPITTMLDQGLSLEAILNEVLEDVQVKERMDLQFRCKCSQERVEQTLISLGRDELEDMIARNEPAEVVCHFCNETYRFDTEHLQALLERAL